MNFSKFIESDIYWHGTNQDFEEFSYTYVGKGNDQEGPGFYFTNNESTAGRYGKNVAKYHLDLNKTVPLKGKAKISEVRKLMLAAPDLEFTLTNWDEDPVKAFKIALSSMLNQENPHQTFLSVWYDFYKNHEAEYLQNMTNLGYDGIVIPQRDDVIYVVMFSPTKIHRIS